MADTVGTLRIVLQADASEFDKAFAEATADVKELAGKLQKELEPNQRRVNAAVRDFLGTTEIRRAQEYAAAIDKIGDVSKLTAADQKKVNAAITEAINHYKVLGLEAPKNLVGIQKATERAASSMSTVGVGLKSLATTLGVTFSAGALIGFTKQVFATASSIDDMSKRLGVSAEFAQKFKYGLEQTGSSLEAGEKALAVMNRTLAQGDKSTVGALSSLGLKFADVRAMKPEDAFQTIANAAGKIEDPMRRAAVMQELFGRGAIELMPLVVEGYDNVTKGVTTMSDDTVKALSDAEDAWQALWDKVVIITGNMVGALLNAGKEQRAASARAFELFNEEQKQAWAKQQAVSQAMLNGTTFAEEYAKALKRLEKNYHDINLPIEKTTGNTNDLTAAQKLAAAQLEAYRKRIAGIAAQFSGAKLADEIVDLTNALASVGGEAGIDVRNLGTFAQRLDDIARKGGVLTPELEAIRSKFMFFRDMVRTTRMELDLLHTSLQMVAAGGLQNTSLAMQQFQAGRDVEIGRRRQLFQEMASRGPLPGTMGVSLQNQINAQAITRFVPETTKWADALSDVVDAFEDLASIAGGTFSDVTRGIGSGVASARLFHEGFQQLSKPATFAGTLTGIGSIIGALSQAVALGKALHDAVTRSESEKAAADIRRNFNLDVTEDDQVAKDVEALVKRLGIDRNLAIDLLLPKISAGQIDTSNFASFRDRAGELFDDIKLGGEVGQMALQSLDDMLGQLGEHVVEQGGLWDREFVGMLQRAQAEGHELASVMQLVTGQLGIASSGISKATIGEFAAPTKQLSDLRTKRDDLTAKGDRRGAAGVTAEIDALTAGVIADQQDDFDRLSRLALSTFNAYVANGKSAAEAVAAVGPAIDSLKQATTDFGFAGNAAFEQLSRWRDLTTANQPLLDQIGGLNEMMAALANIGALDAQTFADMQAQGLDAFGQLTAAGFTQQEALAQMAPMLETIRDLHTERGLAIDDETKKLIDQAEQQGILAEQTASETQVQLDLTAALVEAVGGTLPESYKKWRDAATQTTNDIAGQTEGLASTVTDELGDAVAGDDLWRALEIKAKAAFDEAERIAREATSGIEGAFKDLDIEIDVGFNVDSPSQYGIDGDWKDYLPGAADGAHVKRRPGGTPMILGEGRYNEFVIPEPDLRALIDDWNRGIPSFEGQLANQMSGFDEVARGTVSIAGGGTAIINVEGREIARAIVPHVPGEMRRYGLK